MRVPLYQIDAFTKRPFAGNPAAVCMLDAWPDEVWMQNVAAEMNLSETAFVVPEDEGYGLRWFTPSTEVDLCGHATLATAHLLWEEDHLAPEAEARFQTRSGTLTARRDGGWITMDFPSEPADDVPAPPALQEALGVPIYYCAKNRFDYLVLLDTEQDVRALAPDMAMLKSIPARGFMVTAPATKGEYDFVSRFFGPGAGIPEDPVTGSAHCCLGPFWQQRLGKDTLIGYQASARGGIVRVEPRGDRVLLSGQAVTVMAGSLLV